MSLKSLLFFVAVALLLSFFAGSSREGIADFFKTFLSIHNNKGSSYNARRSRFNSLFLIIAFLVTSLFLSLSIQEIIDGNIASFRELSGWAPIILRRVSIRAVLISLLSLLIYIAAKSLGIAVFSSIHLRKGYSKANIDFFLSYLMMDALLLLLILFCNEIYPMKGLVIFWLFTALWILTKIWSALHIYVHFSAQGISFLPFLLYFCSLEIMPLPVFCKCLFLLS